MKFETLTVNDLEEILDHAWQNAIKYRFDPVAGRIHEEYLDMIKKIRDKKQNNK